MSVQNDSIQREARLAMRRGLSMSPRFSVGWHQAIFEHYRVIDEARIVAELPTGLQLDRHDGVAYLSVVSFVMVDMRWRGWRLPFLRRYPQINIRVYVRSDDKFGVFFLRNHVSNRLAATFGRLLYGMPYRHCSATLESVDGVVTCHAVLPTGVDHRVSGTRGEQLCGHESDPASLLHFLCERYPLFSSHRGQSKVAAMLHAPWALYTLDVGERSHGAIADLGLDDALLAVEQVQTSPGVNTLMWRPYRLGAMPALVERECPSAE